MRFNMKALSSWICLSALFLFVACGGGSSDSAPSSPVDSTASNPVKDSLSDLRSFSNAILNDGLAPGDNALTLMCLDSLLSPVRSVRDHYFSVFLVICAKADGVLTELVSATGLDYIEQFPEEAIGRVKELPDVDREMLSERLAYDFYASGGQIKSDVNEYFQDIEKAVSPELASVATGLKKSIIEDAQELKDLEQE